MLNMKALVMILSDAQPVNWQGVITTHRLESEDRHEWLLYGTALLITLRPGQEEKRQQQQAALAFVQAEKHGASAQEVEAAQWRAVQANLGEALAICGIDLPKA